MGAGAGSGVGSGVGVGAGGGPTATLATSGIATGSLDPPQAASANANREIVRFLLDNISLQTDETRRRVSIYFLNF